jgi:hypothetical protein
MEIKSCTEIQIYKEPKAIHELVFEIFDLKKKYPNMVFPACGLKTPKKDLETILSTLRKEVEKQELIAACQSCDLNKIKGLIDKSSHGSSINVFDVLDTFKYFSYSDQNSLRVVNYLYFETINLKAMSFEEEIILLIFRQNVKINISKIIYFLAKNKDNEEAKNFITHFCVKEGDLTEYGYELLSHTAPNSSSSLMLDVVKLENFELVKFIFKFPSAMQHIDSVFSQAIRQTNLDIINYLINLGANISTFFYNRNFVYTQPQILSLIISRADKLLNENYYDNGSLLNNIRNYYNKQFTVNILMNYYHISYVNTNSLNDFDEFFSMINNIWLSEEEKLKEYNKRKNLSICINSRSRGKGVLRHLLNNYCETVLKNTKLFAPVFTETSHHTQDFSTVKTFMRDSIEDCYMYIPHYNESPSPVLCDNYRNLGVVLGCAFLYDAINLHLSSIIYKYLANETIILEDFLPKYSIKILHDMETYTEEEFDNLCMNMTVSYTDSNGCAKTYELVPGGNDIPLSPNNFNEYKKNLLNFFLKSGYKDVVLSCISQGFHKIIDVPIPSGTTFALIYQGKIRIPTIDWIKYCRICLRFSNVVKRKKYALINTVPEKLQTNDITCDFIGGLNQNLIRQEFEVPVQILWFFQILHELSDEEYFKLVKFFCGTDIVPVTQIQDLSKNELFFKIQLIASDDKKLPEAATCFHSISICEYQSKEILFKKLLMAITECDDLHLS